MHRTIASSSHALKYSSCLCLVLVLALGSPTSVGAQPPTSTPALDGLFLPLGGGLSAEVQGALAESVQRDRLVADGVIRSRRVAIDFALLGERVQGLLGRPAADPGQDQAPLLLLNFFDDASIEVLVDSVEPTVLENGYVVSGSVPGQPGSVVLVVHADRNDRVVAVSGSASTADGAFRVSTIGGGTYSIEEVDTTVPWVDGVLPDEPELADPPPPPSPGPSGAAFSLVDPAVAAASSGVSEIDVLVLYTPAAAAYAGGEASMRAEVERLFGETNRAFRNSGVSARVAGWARAVSYSESQDVGTDLDLLQGSFDGYLDDGWHIGITGWVCDERRGQDLARLVGRIPDDKLMIETDAPYLLPRTITPRPRARRNEPAFLGWIARRVAECRGTERADIERLTHANAARFFRLPEPFVA